LNHGVTISKNDSDRITVSFPYSPSLVQRIKNVEGRRWYPTEKYWSFPNSDETLEKILQIFEAKEIHLGPALEEKLSNSHINQNPTLVKLSHQSPPLEKGSEGGFSDKNNTPIILEHNFDDLRRELVSRKYSYKTVKGYLYYNKNFLGFAVKSPSEITDNEIKDYLLYLVEEKESATSTLNQAINALKFYYGTMLKKKFMYEIKRPHKDKKLPIVLSKEEVAKILSSIDNIKHKAILMLVYSAGLRVGEVVRLKPEDIDSERMLIHIKGSKGRKDRYVMLSETALQILREYWRQYKPSKYLFQGAKADRYI